MRSARRCSNCYRSTVVIGCLLNKSIEQVISDKWNFPRAVYKQISAGNCTRYIIHDLRYSYFDGLQIAMYYLLSLTDKLPGRQRSTIGYSRDNFSYNFDCIELQVSRWRVDLECCVKT